MKASRIVAIARAQVGKPYRHQGRAMAFDCAGLPVHVARELGMAVEDASGYGVTPVPSRMKALLDQHLERVDKATIQPGDVVWIRFRDEPQHLAIVGDYRGERLSLIHATNGAGLSKVVEHILDATWMRRVVGVWRYPGVEA